jgi:hypothetical protein
MKVSRESDRGYVGSYDSKVTGLLKIGAPALLLALIHRSTWNKNSANFVMTEFSEIPDSRVTLGANRARVL